MHNQKNAESFYICRSYAKANGSTSYAVYTDLLDDAVGEILKVSKSRWQSKKCKEEKNTIVTATKIAPQKQIRTHGVISVSEPGFSMVFPMNSLAGFSLKFLMLFFVDI